MIYEDPIAAQQTKNSYFQWSLIPLSGYKTVQIEQKVTCILFYSLICIHISVNTFHIALQYSIVHQKTTIYHLTTMHILYMHMYVHLYRERDTYTYYSTRPHYITITSKSKKDLHYIIACNLDFRKNYILCYFLIPVFPSIFWCCCDLQFL